MKNDFRSYDDNELVALLKGKHSIAEQAFRVLYDRHSGMVHAYCVKVLGNDAVAEDIFQETFIKFYQNVKSEKQFSNIKGFLITIARNLCLNSKRDKKINVQIDKIDFLFFEHQNYEQKELLDLISRSLDLLEDEYREAFVMREYNGLSYNEIAEISKISVSNAKSRVFRAKQKIKQILQPVLKDLNS